ncbi:MAG: MBL fold metallo-hydrolase [Thermoplasmata archaeon]
MPENVHQLRIPTSLPIKESNAYLVEGEPLTLVDTGTYTGRGREVLQEEIRRTGHRLEDIERIVLTHAHADHFGLAAFVKEASGAETCLNGIEREFVEDYPRTFNRRRGFFRDEFNLAGIPEMMWDEIESFLDYLAVLAKPCEVDVVLADGDRVQAGSLELEAIHTPGHSDGSTCFLSEAGELFSGDTLLRDVSWNFTLGGTDVPTSGLAEYVRSLKRIRGMHIRKVFPGHFSPFDDAEKTITEFLELQERRKGQILRKLEGGKLTAHQIAKEVYGVENEQDALLSLSQALGLLHALLESGEVLKDEGSGPSLFSRV